MKEALIGANDLILKLKSLDEKIGGKLLRMAMKEASKPILEEAYQNCPVETGTLRDSLKIHSGNNRKQAWEGVRCGEGFYKGKTFYGGFIEFGYMHVGASHDWGFVHRMGSLISGGGFHIPAQPFMRPAFYNHKQETIQSVRRMVLGVINGVAERGRVWK